MEHASRLKKKRGAAKRGKRKRRDVQALPITPSLPYGAPLGYTTADEVLKHALIKWDVLNYQTGVPFADETNLMNWLTATVIPQVEKLVDEFCRRVDFLKHTAEVEYFNGDGFRDFILVGHRPMISIAKLEFQKADGTWDLKADTDYVVRGDQIQYSTVLPKGWQNIRVTYDWGYAATPVDVGHVAAEICARFLQKLVAYKMGPLVRVADYRIELVNPEVFTQDLKDLLAHYARESGSMT
jgi:hypothetical protein